MVGAGAKRRVRSRHHHAAGFAMCRDLLDEVVLVSEDEQPAGALDAAKEELHRLPRVGELQLPAGQGLPPVSQPSFPGLEPSLPAFGHPTEDSE